MHTPTAFILRCADSPSYFYPGDSPSHHLSHPLTARPHTLSKHISFFLCSFLYFFIFFLLSFFLSVLPSFFFSHLPSLFLSALLLQSVSWLLFCHCGRRRFSFWFLCSAAASLYRARQPLFIFCDTFVTRPDAAYISTTFVIPHLAIVCIIRQQRRSNKVV